MKKNLDTLFKNLDGTDCVNMDKPVSIKSIVIDTLLDVNIDGQQQATSEEKLKRYDLAMRCKDGGDVDFTVEELSLLKSLVGKKWAPLIVGQFYHYCDGEPMRAVSTNAA